jgi:mRNA interferase YafQ
MLAVVYRKKFKKNLDMMIRRGKNPEKIKEVILVLASGNTLDIRYKDHALSGNLSGFRDGFDNIKLTSKTGF